MAFVNVPEARRYRLTSARIPAACCDGLGESAIEAFQASVDGLLSADIEIQDGFITSITPAAESSSSTSNGAPVLDLQGAIVFPTFADLHTHIDKGHTCERSRNPDGSLSGADRSTAADADFWDAEDVFRRMDFSVACAYAHGTGALRTHLINMAPKQLQLTWPAFSRLRAKWAGKVELQGVSLVVLSFYRDLAAATALADMVAAHGGALGAAVCCAENGGSPEDQLTTCDGDREQLLDRIFTLAKERDLDLDFHVDENPNQEAKGLRYVALKTIQYSYQGRVVCGHCCSLAFQTPEDVAETLALVKQAAITMVSLPLVNEWTQDRDHSGRRTPRWRGITTLHEARAAGCEVVLASDNTRDQFYAYGDLDMLEVFTQACRIGHLDRPYGDWPRAVSWAAWAAMRLPGGRLQVGAAADFVIFRGRRYSELMSRPQHDRVVVRNGRAISAKPPDYSQLDYSIHDTRQFDENLNPESATSRTTAFYRSGSSMLSQCAAALYSAVQSSAGNGPLPAEVGGGVAAEPVGARRWQPSWATVTAALAAGVISGYLCCRSAHMRTAHR